MREFFLRHGAPLYFGLKSLPFWPFRRRGFRIAQSMKWLHDALWSQNTDAAGASEENPLKRFFDSNLEGPGIWKWEHYFEIYHRHFERFRGKEVHIVEIGVFSGGSLQMWKEYFGPNCHVYGVDIEESCRAYEDENVRIFIGDQASRSFWDTFRKKVPRVDIVIDDGGHIPNQQIVTFEEMFPHLAPGGVFLCEDVHFAKNPFAVYMNGLSQNLHSFERYRESSDMERRMVCSTSSFQAWCRSIHTYPFVCAVEKRNEPLTEFVAPRHGTVWEPFYGDVDSPNTPS